MRKLFAKTAPVVTVASTKSLYDITQGLDGLAEHGEFGFLLFHLVPDIRWLNMFRKEQTLPTSRDLSGEGKNEHSKWVAITAWGADALRIENELAAPDSLRSQLKQAVLLFDVVAVYDLVPVLRIIPDEVLTAEIEWLWQQGVLCQPEIDDREYSELSAEYERMLKSAMNEGSKYTVSVYVASQVLEAKGLTQQAHAFRVRGIADAIENEMWLRSLLKHDGSYKPPQ